MFRWQKKTHNWARVGLSSLPPKIYSTMYLSMRFLQTKVVLQMILHVWIMYWIAWLFPPRSNQTEGQFLCKILHPSEESDFTNLKNIEEKAFQNPHTTCKPQTLFLLKRAKRNFSDVSVCPWSQNPSSGPIHTPLPLKLTVWPSLHQLLQGFLHLQVSGFGACSVPWMEIRTGRDYTSWWFNLSKKSSLTAENLLQVSGWTNQPVNIKSDWNHLVYLKSQTSQRQCGSGDVFYDI